ncbi:MULTISPECIES: Ig-like domain-containing protein [Haloferax]|uniref:Ig-like domain-containing protein n=1 Tax=Haloferax TaxID=2251 RepID=UPI00177D0E35|nr:MULTISPECIES: Ig-like domain-containing protein [Haloferax]
MTHKQPSKHILSPLRHVSRELAARFGSDRSHLRTDDRGASAILGTMFAFALVVSVVAMVQVSAVPAWNQQTEFEHLQTVEGEFATFDERIAKASSGTPSRVSLEAGVDYPTRALFVSPAAGSGTIRTTDPATVTIRNARAIDEPTKEYWNGDAHEFDSQMLLYQPDYRYLQNDPVLTHEGVVRYTKYESGEVGASQSLIDGKRISLVLLEGDLDVGVKDATTFSVVPLSAGTEYISVNSNGTPIQISVPTHLSNETWSDLLESERYADVVDYNDTTGADYNLVTVELVGGPVYDLHIARVGIDTPGTPQPPEYIVDISGNGDTVPANARHLAVVEVRDAQNNPVANAPVVAGTILTDPAANVEAHDTGTSTTVTDENGRATFEYTYLGSPDGIVDDQFDVHVMNSSGPDAYVVDTVTFTVEIRESNEESIPRGFKTKAAGSTPYADLNGNGLYDGPNESVTPVSRKIGKETYVAYDAGSSRLVVPSDIGTVVATDGLLLEGNGVSLHTDLVSTSGDIWINGGSGPVHAVGTRMTAIGSNGDITIETDDSIDFTGASVISQGDVTIYSKQEMTLDKAGITSEKDGGVLSVTSDSAISGIDADISGKGSVSVAGSEVDLSGAGISSTKDTQILEVKSTSGGLTLTGVVMDGDGGISLDSADVVELRGGSLASSKTGSDIVVQADNSINGEEVSIVATRDVKLLAGTYVYLETATIVADSDSSNDGKGGNKTNKGDVTISPTGADCTGATISPAVDPGVCT